MQAFKKKHRPIIFNFSKARDKNSNNRIPLVKTCTRAIVNVHKGECQMYIKLLTGFRSGKEDINGKYSCCLINKTALNISEDLLLPLIFLKIKFIRVTPVNNI